MSTQPSTPSPGFARLVVAGVSVVVLLALAANASAGLIDPVASLTSGGSPGHETARYLSEAFVRRVERLVRESADGERVVLVGFAARRARHSLIERPPVRTTAATPADRLGLHLLDLPPPAYA